MVVLELARRLLEESAFTTVVCESTVIEMSLGLPSPGGEVGGEVSGGEVKQTGVK